MHIGHKIRELRKDRGISAKEFARLLDVKSRQCTYDFEKRESVTTDNLKK